MDTARKLGIGIVMIIPTFVVAGALWQIFSSWLAVIVWIAIMAAFTAALLLAILPFFKDEDPPSFEGNAQGA
jgi:hypothetical protein